MAGEKQNRRNVLIPVLASLFASCGLFWQAQAKIENECGSHWMVADAETPPGQSLPSVVSPDYDSGVTEQCEEQPRRSEPTADRYSTPSAGLQNTQSNYDRYSTSSGGSQNSSPSYDRYSTPSGGSQNTPSNYDRYATPASGSQSSSPSYDRYSTPSGGLQNNSSDYNRYTTAPNGTQNNSPAYNPLADIINQFGRSLASPAKPPASSRSSGDVTLETGDVTDGDLGVFGTMLIQDVQPEKVAVTAAPIDKVLVENLDKLDKRAQDCTKETFAPVAAEAETLGVSLIEGGSQIPEAAKSFDIAYKTRSRFVSPLDPSLLSPSLGLADSAFGGDNFESAIIWYQQSLDILEKWKPQEPAEKDASLAKCLGGLAGCYIAQGDGSSALPYAKRMYELVKSKYGAQSSQVLWGAATLGECYRLSRMENELKPLLDEMFDISLARVGSFKRTGSLIPGSVRTLISERQSRRSHEFRSSVFSSLLDARTTGGVPQAFGALSLDPGMPGPARSGYSSVGTGQPDQVLAVVPENLKLVDQKNRQSFSQEVPIRFWFPSQAKPRGIFVCIHGMCLHSGSYAALAGTLQASGYAVVALDVRGCGTWKNSFGQNFLNLEGAISDIRNIIERMHGLFPDTPIFLMGESMGGGIALHAGARHPEHLAGVISSVPGASRFDQVKETLMVILNLPFGLSRPLDISKGLLLKATGNPQLRDVWKTDPLSRKMLSPKELIRFQSFMSDNTKFAVKLNTRPVLVIQGMDDHLVKPPSTLKIYRRISSVNKSLLEIKSGEHLTLEMNQCTPLVLENLVSWVTSNSPKGM
ncbi:MAG: alpha/beta fold hydrolase [Candidatus Obscuribacter sp.]|nr:alpha/beta fold hydrolase [Candidatus Obscuribacter sp.]